MQVLVFRGVGGTELIDFVLGFVLDEVSLVLKAELDGLQVLLLLLEDVLIALRHKSTRVLMLYDIFSFFQRIFVSEYLQFFH